ncbi:MAG: helix-turn-helix domain-containing protein [Hydrogenophaga sp.]|uniref:helix-turn-helix domain-containing protein n=1 Tax=Hydrogenophaga sp. TaxID=1904254 RepID=UPI00273051B6|nr:helix-turn-helix domain-containing protein [Hydrogenophaga sp.]MDP2250684.1 helix-turn-helix domain-containing protein [Hydrogenophaga sp.]MDP3205414.1 helix-turn-helix domain-containing protein [Hydrogenophaga sp.]MDP3625084.1 helix-turn-helix domain-containing protein [Hydrogenophaga sp.]
MSSSPRLCDLTILERLARLPDSALLTSSEAAFLLRISLSTLERKRRDGSGPVYCQSGEIGAKGSNQKCVYLKADLDAFVKARRVGSSMEAAVRKGQMMGAPSQHSMFNRLEDLSIKRAFYMNTSQKVDADIEYESVDTFVARLGKWKIVWLNALEASAAVWVWPSQRSAFVQRVKPVLQKALSEVGRFELVDF